MLGMTETLEPPPQVVVRVVPRLLSDVLGLVLAGRRLAVTMCPTVERRAVPRRPRWFDLAIVTDGLPPDIRAERIIVVDDDGVPSTPGPVRSAALSGGDTDLSTLLALIDDLLP